MQKIIEINEPVTLIIYKKGIKVKKKSILPMIIKSDKQGKEDIYFDIIFTKRGGVILNKSQQIPSVEDAK